MNLHCWRAPLKLFLQKQKLGRILEVVRPSFSLPFLSEGLFPALTVKL